MRKRCMMAMTIAAAGLCQTGPSALGEEPPQAVSAALPNGPLPTDPRLVRGELPNGLKYIVVKHATPPGRANLYLHVSTGSLNETDRQRGLAHYLEHMAFNGSEHFPPGSVVPLFESLGLTFGRHQNASTSFDQTTYILSLPDTSDEKLDKGLLFLSDVAFRLALLPAEVDAERQIIQEERRRGLGAQQRVMDKIFKEIAPGSLLGERLPIGTEETINGVTAQDFKDYYAKWYVPGNMTLLIVADTDPAGIVARLTTQFAVGAKTATPADQDPRIAPTATTRGVVVTDPELTDCAVSLVRMDKPQPPATTYELARERLVEQIMSAAFNRRVDMKVSKGTLTSLGGGASTNTRFDAARWTEVNFESKPEGWKSALTELGTELQRARLHGFTQREIDDVKKEILAGAERAVETESTQDGRALVGSLTRSVARREPFLSARQRLDLIKAYLPTITRDEVSTRFAAIFDPTAVTFTLIAPAGTAVPSDTELASLGSAAVSVRPEPDTEAARAESLLTKLPTPGAITEQTTHEASGVASAWLVNGVRTHHRFMDIRKDSVTVSIILPGGAVLEDATNRGISDVAGLAWSQPATGTLSSTDIRDLMTGAKVRVFGGASDDQMTLTVSGSPTDLEKGFQLAHLLLTDPRIEQSAFDQWKQRTRERLDSMDKSPDAAFFRLVRSTQLPAGDPRTQVLTREQLDHLSLPAAQAWLTKTIASAPIEVSIVGDIPRQRALELVQTYLGSLPKRDRIAAATLDDKRALKQTKGPHIASSDMQTQTQKAFVVSGFYTADLENTPDNRAMQLASQTLSSRMVKVIREQEQLVYSISARNEAGVVWPGLGLFGAQAPTEPTKVDALVARLESMYKEFAASGPTQEELAVARKQIANTLDEQFKDPGYWTQRLTGLTYRNTRLDEVVDAPRAYQAITAEEIKAAFNKYYKPESVVVATLRPRTQ